jgi:hypothetical protein
MLTHGVCKHSRYSEVLLANARDFLPLFVGEGFPRLNLVFPTVISFSFFVIACRVYNKNGAPPID